MKTLILMTLFFIISFSLFADGFIRIDRPPPGFTSNYMLEVKYHFVNVSIKNELAETAVDEIFYNPSSSNVEGYYYFPIPKNASIKKFSMYINGKETEAELLDSAKARKIYEDILRTFKDPALLEYVEQGLFRVKIFPIEPRGERRVKISYTELLKRDSGTYEYVYPLNTEKFSSKEVGEVKVDIAISNDSSIKNLYCTTHETKITRKNENEASLSFYEKNTKPDTDFKINFSTGNSKFGISMLPFRESSRNDGFFYLDIAPEYIKDQNTAEPRDIVFVVDTSGSMMGKKLEQAKNALNYCIENLNDEDRFEIIRFSTDIDQLFGESTPANKKENIENAKKFISRFKPTGGTNIEDALKAAIKTINTSNRKGVIIFLTDGKPTINETNEDNLLKGVKGLANSNTKIFTFGVGFDINTHLLDKITTSTKAYSTYITPDEDIEVKISDFYNKIKMPVLSDISLSFDNIRSSVIYPVEIPDIFAGSSVNIVGKYSGNGSSTVTLTGKVNSKLVRYQYQLDFPEENLKNESIPILWAARRVGFLLDQIRLNGENQEVVEEITQLSKKYGIITPYTSYLIVEDETRRISRNEINIGSSFLGSDVKPASEYRKELKKDYESFSEKSGEGGVNASKNTRSLSISSNIAQTKQESYQQREKGKSISNVQTKNIEGRIFYNNGKLWVDSNISSNNKLKIIKIKFASSEYYELLNEKGIHKILTLGRNVTFLFKNNIYEIFE